MYRFPDPLDEDALRPLMADERYGDPSHPEHPFYRKFVDRAFALVYPDPPRDGAGNFVVDRRDPPKPQVITGGAEFKPWEDGDGRDQARESSNSSWHALERGWSAPEAPSSPAPPLTADDVERMRQRATNMRPDLSGPFTGPADARPSPESADSLAYQDAFQRGWPAPVSPLPAPPPPNSVDDELSRQRLRAGLARTVRGPEDAQPSGAQADSRAAQDLIKGVIENPKPAPSAPFAPLVDERVPRSTLAGRELGDIFDDLGRGSALNKDVEESRQLRRDAIANPGDDAVRSQFENKKREVAEKFRNQIALKVAEYGMSEALDYALFGPLKLPITTAEMILAVGTKYGTHKAVEHLVDAMVDSALEHAIKQPSRPIRNPDEATRALAESGRYGVYRERESPDQRAYDQIFKGRSK